MAEARWPYVLSRWRGMCSRFCSAGRRCLWLDSGTQWTARYWGARPFRHQCPITTSLKVTWSRTLSHWDRLWNNSNYKYKKDFGTPYHPLFVTASLTAFRRNIPRLSTFRVFLPPPSDLVTNVPRVLPAVGRHAGVISRRNAWERRSHCWKAVGTHGNCVPAVKVFKNAKMH